jgi:tRNA 5-methylaminomethyl-2-thiouridine biosynthesis bifunctional protein
MTDPCIEPARLSWRDDQPYSEAFRDIYHAPDGAAEVARVFLAPSGLPACLRAGQPLRIGELGFGTGLNFAVAAAACLAAGSPLHFLSFEAAPIAPADFARLAQRRSSRYPIYAELSACYPPLIEGWHQRRLAGGRIRLTLYWGDAEAGLQALLGRQQQPLSAWFLDGFAPDRNPALWTDALFARLAELSATGTTVATFTAAGRVRRALARAGFAMRRVDQRPHKRESLAGTFAGRGLETRLPPPRATVIGAGLAGASMARHLAEAGVTVTVYDPHPPGRPAAALAAAAGPGSHIPTSVLHARLLADTGAAGRLRCHAFHYAAAFAAGFAGFARTGVLQLPAADANPDRLAAINDIWGASGPWLVPVDVEEARVRTGWPVAHGGLWFRDGGCVDTPTLCAALVDHPGIELVGHAAELPAGPATTTPVVLACGIDCLAATPARYLELVPVLGQLDFVTMAALPRAPIVGNGYLTPGPGSLAAGATYEHRPWQPKRATERNLAQLAGHTYQWQGRARGVRTTSSDRTAVAGPLYAADGRSLAPLYVSTGHGSMGNVSCHFAAALITAAITGATPPLGVELDALLSPLRFRLRQRRRGLRHGAQR